MSNDKSKLSGGISYDSYGRFYCDLRVFTEGDDKEVIERFTQAMNKGRKELFLAFAEFVQETYNEQART
ncbi:MAG: hypothetical protein OXF05_02630 [Hyphomicrobiales bacterium]|nr:hypothetical protein [Hyphomicrobiales bacterium]MCY4038301.1 hypothetical protein [Hyphomicrobiales bacterium]